MEQRLKQRLITDKGDRPELGILAPGQPDCGHDLGGAKIATHGVNCDATGCSGRHIHRVDGAGVKREA